MSKNDKNFPKPFLKWAGGKTQILNKILPNVPVNEEGIIEKYFEPFLGGGAVFFGLSSKYDIGCAYLIDSNKDLMITYKVIQDNHSDLIIKLKDLEKEYDEANDRKKLFNMKREEFNQIHNEDFNGATDVHIDIASLMIFLNKTCFNGLYRVNKKNEFNVPFANPKKPLICDKQNIINVHNELEKNVHLVYGDYSKSKKYIDENSFVYLDPPYRPINGKKSFEGYSKYGFDDNNQADLADFCCKIWSENHAKFILSNSNPKNYDENDDFFERLYPKKKGFYINEVSAKRFINSNASKRGPISELLISNYEIVVD